MVVKATPDLAKRLRTASWARSRCRKRCAWPADRFRRKPRGAHRRHRHGPRFRHAGQSSGNRCGGAVLAQITSTDLTTQQLAYVRARSAYELNRRNAERARTLLPPMSSAPPNCRSARRIQRLAAEMRAAADQLRLLG
jgi:cobalt-zinc-cadmium efflux system membrane fusion protein